MSTGYTNLRFIGGSHHGQSEAVPNSRQTAIKSTPKSTVEPGRYERRVTRVSTRLVDESYNRTVVQIIQPNFIYTETCMVLAGTSIGDAQRHLLSLGLPKVDLPTMKPLAIRPSTAVKALAYCPRTATLDVSLPGGTYRYANVPKDVVFNFVTSDSLGGFYGDNIRNKYDCTRLT